MAVLIISLVRIPVHPCQDAIAKWCEKMAISQGDRTDDEMVDFINGYEYENEDTYYYINKFTFG